MQEPGRVEIPRARRVDHFGHRLRVDHMDLLAGDDERSLLAAGEGGHGTLATHRLQGRIEGVHLVERENLGLVGEENIDVARHQLAEGFAVTLDTKGVGKRQRHLSFGVVGQGRRLDEGLLGRLRVPQVALQICDGGGANLVRAHILRCEIRRGAQVGRHGALRVLGDENQTAGRGLALARRCAVEGDAGGADVVAKDLAELIVANPADEAGTATEAGDPDHGVRRRTAGHLQGRPHGIVEIIRSAVID